MYLGLWGKDGIGGGEHSGGADETPASRKMSTMTTRMTMMTTMMTRLIFTNIHSLSLSSSPLWGLLLGLSCCPGLRGRPSPFDLRPPCVRPPWGKEKISMRSKVNKSYLLPDNITDSISGCCSIIIIVFINPPGAGPSCRFGCKHRCLHFQGSPTRLRATLVRRIAFHFRIIGQGRISG